jgi:hypothetical protein
MSVLAILMISGLFVLAAMVGLADAFLHLILGIIGRLRAPKSKGAAQPPAQGITA